MSTGNLIRRLLGIPIPSAEQRARSRGESARVEASLLALGYEKRGRP